MNDGSPLINIDLKGVAKTAETLIEKVSDAVGGIAKPGQIVRVAKAAAKAELIRAENRIEISETEERALQRMVHEEGKRQENIENITAKTIPLLSEDAKPEDVEDDWITHFFDKCRLVSDEEMQTLWSSVLAGQSNKPGSFSKRTVDLISTLEKSDAELFTKFCSFVWNITGPTPVIYDTENEIINKSGINFGNITHLDDIGLVTFNNVMNYTRLKLGKRLPVFYHGRAVVLEFPKDTDNNLEVGHVILTNAGEELLRICNPIPSEEYYEEVLAHWDKRGVIVSVLSNKEPPPD